MAVNVEEAVIYRVQLDSQRDCAFAKSGMRIRWTPGQRAHGCLRDGHQVPGAVSERIDRNPEGANVVGVVTRVEYPLAARAAV
jgi:hypothetical protein